MRYPSGQLAQAFEFSHFMDLSERLLALLRALFDSLFELGVSLGELGVSLGELGGPPSDPVLQLRVQPLELPRLAVELGENLDLGPQQLGNDRDRNVVHRSKLITAQEVEIVHLNSGYEDDCGLLKAGVLADHCCQLKAVEVGHADVDQNDRDIAL